MEELFPYWIPSPRSSLLTPQLEGGGGEERWAIATGNLYIRLQNLAEHETKDRPSCQGMSVEV